MATTTKTASNGKGKTVSRAIADDGVESHGKRATAAKLPVKIRQTKMLIDGKWVNSTSGRTFETINPATGDVIAHVAEGEAADVDKAVKAARLAFDKGLWRKMNAR